MMDGLRLGSGMRVVLAGWLLLGLAGATATSRALGQDEKKQSEKSGAAKSKPAEKGKPIPPDPFPGRKIKAPPLEGGLGWLNAAGPVELAKLKGKIVILDFWTFCCINCMHVLPDLAKLEKEFPNELVVIGVHSAKFSGERDTQNIRDAVLRYDIKHPVVNDGKMEIWRTYGVRSWPTLVLIDPEGFYIGRQPGEGNYETFRLAIQKLIEFHGAKRTLDARPLHFQLESLGSERTPLRFPGKVAVDVKNGRLYISDSSHHRVVVVDLASRKVLHVIGDGKAELKDGPLDKARFNDPQGLAFAGDVLYVADTRNHALRKIDLETGKVTTLAGDGKRGYERAFVGKASQVSLASPWDLQLIGDQLYIANAGTHQLWKLDLKKGSVAPFSGSGKEDLEDGEPQIAAFAQPSGLTNDGTSIYVADSEISAIRQVDLATGAASTLVGEGLFDFGDEDGVGKAAKLQHALGVAYHGGRLYVADTYNNKLKTIDLKTKEVASFLGDGKPGTGDSPPRFDEPGGLTIAAGKLYVADTNNHAIRVVNLADRKVQTLKFEGLTAPAAHDGDTALPDGKIVTVASVALKPGAVKISARVPVGADQKLNPKAPMSYTVERIDAQGKASAVVSGRVKPPADRFTVDLPADKIDLAATKQLRLSVVFYPCDVGSEGVCRIESRTWHVPVTVDADKGLTTIELAP